MIDRILACPKCGSPHLRSHCEQRGCVWFVCRKCGCYGLNDGSRYAGGRTA